KMSEIDYFYEMDCERAEGCAEGKSEGLAEGLAQGLAQGRTEGEQAKAAEVAKTMLADGLDSSFVSKYSGLSFEQVEELKKSL
ncbi:MAG: hypothetical protein ACI3Y4_00490, partial [Candidatus Cryptobacteroides sp.]